MGNPTNSETPAPDHHPAVRPAGRTGSRRAWWISAGALLLLALVFAMARGDKTHTVYTDGLEKQAEAEAQLRSVVWTSPKEIFPGLDPKVDRYDATVSADGQTLIFVIGRPQEGADLYIATRPSIDAAWSEPVAIEVLNTEQDELGPALSGDGQQLYFYSDRAGGKGGYDIWHARRLGAQWTTPVNLGQTVNTRFDEMDPAIRLDADLPEGAEAAHLHPAGLYFASNRPRPGQPEPATPDWRATARLQIATPLEEFDLYFAGVDRAKVAEPAIPDSTDDANATSATAAKPSEKPVVSEPGAQFSAAQRLEHLNTPQREAQPALTRLGDYLYFASNRDGGAGGFDLYRARWFPQDARAPQPLGAPVNTAANDTDPALFAGGHEMIFSSDRATGDAKTYQLFHSRTTEVVPFAQAQAATKEAFSWWAMFAHFKWWLLLLLVALLALVALLRNFTDEERRRRLSLIQKCLLASVLLHVMLTFLATFWLVSNAVYKSIINEEVVEIHIDPGTFFAKEEPTQQAVNTQAGLERISAAMPVPEQVEPNAAPPTGPASPQRTVETPSVKPEAVALTKPQTSDLKPEGTALPKLNNDPLEPALPQMANPQLEVARTNPAETSLNPQATKEITVRPATTATTPAGPVNPTTQAPASTVAATSAAANKMTATAKVDPTALPPLENPLPSLEELPTRTTPLEQPKVNPDVPSNLAQATKSITVQPGQTAAPTAVPLTAATTAPATAPMQQTTVAKEQSAEAKPATANLSTAQVQPSLPANTPAQATSLEKAQTVAEGGVQMARASTQQSVQQQTGSTGATAATPQATGAKSVDVATAAVGSTAAKAQATTTASAAQTLAAASGQTASTIPSANAPAGAVMEKSQTVAEGGVQMARASTQQSVQQQTGSTGATAATPQATGAKSVDVAAATGGSTAVTQSVAASNTQSASISAAAGGTNLSQATVATGAVLEKGQAQAEGSATLAKTGTGVAVAQAAAPGATTAPMAGATQKTAGETGPATGQSAAAQQQLAGTKADAAATGLTATSGGSAVAQATVAQAETVSLDRAQTTGEAGVKMAAASSGLTVGQAAATSAGNAPAAAASAANAAAQMGAAGTASTAAKAQTANTAAQSGSIQTAQVNSTLPAAQQAGAPGVKMESAGATAAAGQQLAAVSNTVGIAQSATAAGQSAPVTGAAKANAAAVSGAALPATSAAAQGSAATQTTAAAQLPSVKMDGAALQASAGGDSAAVTLESGKSAVDGGQAAGKIGSQLTLGPAAGGAERAAPAASTVAANVAGLRLPNQLLATNAAPARLLPGSGAKLSAASAAQVSLPELAATASGDATKLESVGATPAEQGAAFGKATSAVSNLAVKGAPASATGGAAIAKTAAPETGVVAGVAGSGVRAQQVAALAPKSGTLASATGALANLPQPTTVSPSQKIQLEGVQPSIAPGDSFASVSAGQAVKPLAQSGRPGAQAGAPTAALLAMVDQRQIFGLAQSTAQPVQTTGSSVALSRFSQTDKAAPALDLPGVQMETAGGQSLVAAKGDRPERVSSTGAAPKAAQGATQLGQPLAQSGQQSTAVAPLPVQEIQLTKGNPEVELVFNARPMAKLSDANDVLKLPDLGLPTGPMLEAPLRGPDPLVLRHDPKKRVEIIERLGGNPETEKAVMRALDWFTRNQEKNGSWDGPGDHDVAATGMAMLAYMGWGAKHTEAGPYQQPLIKAVDWMVQHVEKKGDLRPSKGGNYMYDHGIAAIAVAEAYSLTKDPRLRPVVERIVDFTVRAQNPKTGGWRYSPYGEKGYNDRGDLSVTGWQIMALKSAQIGGVPVPAETFDRARGFMDLVGGGRNKGTYGYYTSNDPTPAMVAEGMFVQQLLGVPPTHARMDESARFLERELPSPRQVSYNYYFWYYGCLAMHQHQGPVWERWNARLRPILLKGQIDRSDRSDLDGSWDPAGQWGSNAGRCVVTAMAALSLEVYYRYLPLYTPAWAEAGTELEKK
ncbi:MAG: hypothetical protein EXS28_10525 [Pedosphaera sp.]|nr:hypothetical protein [Pedosphaera sp.]